MVGGSGGGGPKGWGPEGWGPEGWGPEGWAPKGGAPKGGAPKGGAPKRGALKGGAPNPEKVGPEGWGLERLGASLPPEISFFLLSLGGLLVEFWWCLKCRGRQMCAFGVLWLLCEAPAAPPHTQQQHTTYTTQHTPHTHTQS